MIAVLLVFGRVTVVESVEKAEELTINCRKETDRYFRDRKEIIRRWCQVSKDMLCSELLYHLAA